jgi:hypothetical protein
MQFKRILRMTINGFVIFKEFFLGFILFIAVLPLVLFIYKKYKKRNRLDINHMAISTPFEKEVFLQLLNQQFEKSFGTISDSLINEYRIIYKMISSSKYSVKANSFLMDSDHHAKHMLPENNEDSNISINSVSDGNLYDEALSLAASGFSSTKIAEMLHVPFGEIDLIMKLNSNEVSWDNMERKYN